MKRWEISQSWLCSWDILTLLSREEVKAMLRLSLEETRVYQEAKAEGQEKILKAAVPLLLKTGMSIEQIAQDTSL